MLHRPVPRARTAAPAATLRPDVVASSPLALALVVSLSLFAPRALRAAPARAEACPSVLAQETAPPQQQQQQPRPQEPPEPAKPPQAPPPQQLTLEHVFGLPRRLVDPGAMPREWIDANQYLAFREVEGEGGKKGPKAFLKVEATTGAATPLLDHDKMAAALAALPGFPREDAERLARDDDALLLSPARAAVLVRAANDLFLYSIAAGAAWRLTSDPAEEVGPQFSPDGRLVAFVRDHDLHVVPTERGGHELALTQGGGPQLLHGRLDWVYQEELYGRGNWQGFWWSPDSARIALLRLDERPVPEFTLVNDVPSPYPAVESVDYPKAGAPNPIVAVGAVEVGGGPVRWFDLSRYAGVDLLVVRVSWHPDGSEVWFQVQDREQRWLDLLAGDPRTGKVRHVLREESKCWVEADAVPEWLDGGKSFLWLSERDDWKHLYHYGRDGKLLRRITEGPFEVQSIVGVDEQARMVYFETDKDRVRERHLWRIGLDGNGAAPITKEPGVHSVKLSPDRSLFLDSWSSTSMPSRIDVKRMDDQVVRTVAQADLGLLQPFQLVPPEFVQIPTRDGFAMEAMVLRPRGLAEGQHCPVLMYAYAGPHAAQVRDRWSGRNWLWHQLLVQKGIAVVVCDNRSASGKGRGSAAACFRNLGETELHDLEDAADWIARSGLGDPQRIGLWGWSYGGYQTAFNLTHSKRWKLGIAVNPVTDWHLYDSIYTERYMGLPQHNVDGYRKSSVLRAAKDLHGSLLLVCGAMDDNVHPQNSLQLAHALQAAGKQFRFMVYPRVRHGIEDRRQQVHLFTMMTEFVTQNL